MFQEALMMSLFLELINLRMSLDVSFSLFTYVLSKKHCIKYVYIKSQKSVPYALKALSLINSLV